MFKKKKLLWFQDKDGLHLETLDKACNEVSYRLAISEELLAYKQLTRIKNIKAFLTKKIVYIFIMWCCN